MTLKRHIFVKAFLLALFIAFISLGPFGLSHAMMAMGSAPDSNCPFMPGVTVLCKMGPLEHLAAWQSMFASLPSQNSAFLLLVTLCVLLAQTWRWWKEYQRPDRSFSHLSYRESLPIPALQELFADGVPNPKVF